jgi:hypothetical protein
MALALFFFLLPLITPWWRRRWRTPGVPAPAPHP